MTAPRGRFFADLQYRLEDTDFETSTVSGVSDTFLAEDYENSGRTLSGAIGYSVPLKGAENLSLTPTAGFLFSNQETSRVNFKDINGNAQGALDVEDGETRLGFVGATLSKTFVNTQNASATNVFGTMTYYNDFGDDRIATFRPAGGGDPRSFTIENPGSYGEISAGVNYSRILNSGSARGIKQINAGVRVDARMGSNIDSYGLTAQVRLQF